MRTHLLLSKSDVPTETVPSVPVNSPPATNLFAMYIPQTPSDASVTLQLTAPPPSPTAIAHAYIFLFLKTLRSLSRCRNHTQKQPISYPPALQANTTNNTKHVTQSASHHLPRLQDQTHLLTELFLSTPYTVSLTPATTPARRPFLTPAAHKACTTNEI